MSYVSSSESCTILISTSDSDAKTTEDENETVLKLVHSTTGILAIFVLVPQQ